MRSQSLDTQPPVRATRFVTMAAAAVALALTNFATATAQTCTYTGPDNGSWGTAIFWSCGVIPGPAATAIIDNDSGMNRTVILDASRTVSALTITAGDGLTIPNNLDFTVTVGPIMNDGLISFNSTTAAHTFRIGGAEVLLDGAGVFHMNNDAGNSITGSASTNRLTVGAAQTIRGSGALGSNTLRLINDGLIEANQTVDLTIDLSGTLADNQNTGVLQGNGGTLNINGTALNNTGGLIQALDNSAVEVSGSTISDGAIDSAGAGEVRTFGAVTLDSITNDGTIALGNDASLTLLGTILNNDLIEIRGTAATTDLIVGSAEVLLNGNGEVLLGGDGNNQIIGSSSTNRLTVSSGHTIHGDGAVGGNTIRLTNLGLISADVATQTLTVDLAGGVTENFNTGVMQATNTATLSISGTTLDNTDGLIHALDASVTNLASSHITGGVLDSGGTGEVRTSGTSSLNSLVNDGRFVLSNDANLTLTGVIVNNDTIEMRSTSALTDLVVGSADVLLNGNGTVLLGGSGNNQVVGSSSTNRLTVSSGHTIRGDGAFGGNTFRLTNNGTIRADIAGETLTVDLAPALADNLNTGVMQAENGATLAISGTALNNTDGVIAAENGSVVTLSGSTIQAGLLATVGTGEVRASGSVTFDSVENEGTVGVLNNAFLTLLGTIVNDGTIEIRPTSSVTDVLIGAPGVSLNGNGALVLTDSGIGSSRVGGTSSTNLLTIGAGQTVRGRGALGANTLNITNDGTIHADTAGALTIDPSTTFTNNGLLLATGTGGVTLAAGAFANNGTIRVAPGSVVARTGPLTQADAATIHLQIAGTGPDQAGRVTATGAFTRNGILSLEAISGYVPAIGDRIPVFTAQSFNGAFDGITDNFPGTLEATVEYTATTGTVVIIRPGDLNCDGVTNNFDIDPFVLALTDPAGYDAAFPACEVLNGDVNRDGIVNNFDIDPFVNCLVAGCP